MRRGAHAHDPISRIKSAKQIYTWINRAKIIVDRQPGVSYSASTWFIWGQFHKGHLSHQSLKNGSKITYLECYPNLAEANAEAQDDKNRLNKEIIFRYSWVKIVSHRFQCDVMKSDSVSSWSAGHWQQQGYGDNESIYVHDQSLEAVHKIWHRRYAACCLNIETFKWRNIIR